MFKNINSPDFGATTSNIDAIGANKTDLNASIKKVQHSQEDTTQSFFEFLPREMISEIVKKMAYPDLMSFKKAYEGTNENIFDSIDSRVIAKAEQRFNYKFENLNLPDREESINSCNELTAFFDGTLHSNTGNVPVNHNGDNIIKSETLQVINLEGVHPNECFFAGTLNNHCKFVFVQSRFGDQQNGYDTLCSCNGYYTIYMGDSYDEIIQLIKEIRDDALPRHVDRFLKHQKIYF